MMKRMYLVTFFAIIKGPLDPYGNSVIENLQCGSAVSFEATIEDVVRRATTEIFIQYPKDAGWSGHVVSVRVAPRKAVDILDELRRRGQFVADPDPKENTRIVSLDPNTVLTDVQLDPSGRTH